MKPTIMSPEVRLSLILILTAEAHASEWDEDYTSRCTAAILNVKDGERIDVDYPEAAPNASDIDGLTDQQIVSLIADFHFG